MLFSAFTQNGTAFLYGSHFKLSGFVMVEPGDAGSWLGKPCFPSGGAMVFSGGSVSSTRILVQRL